MNVLLLGAGGMLARDMATCTPAGIALIAFHRAQLDVRDHRAVRQAMRTHRPAWLVNCTGITNVEDAERDPDAAFAVNAEAVGAMAAACAEWGTRILHFSTDYVFDGTRDGFLGEEDAPAPLNVYGRSKLAGEEQLRASGAKYLLVRTQWLFGVSGRSFAGLMCERAEARLPVKVVNDEFGCCSYTVDVARTVWELMPRAEGTVHVANRGRLSRFDLAKRIFEHFGVPELLAPCTSEEFGALARRPSNSPLSVLRAEALLGRRMPEWTDAVDRFLQEREENHKKGPPPASRNA